MRLQSESPAPREHSESTPQGRPRWPGHGLEPRSLGPDLPERPRVGQGEETRSRACWPGVLRRGGGEWARGAGQEAEGAGDTPSTGWVNPLRAGTRVVNGKAGEHGSSRGSSEGTREDHPCAPFPGCEQRQTGALDAGLGRGSWLRRTWELGFWPGFGEMPPLKASAFGGRHVASPCSADDKGHRRHHPLLLHLGPESVRGDGFGWRKSSRA